MTREEAKEWLPIIKAFAEGKTVQIKVRGKWVDLCETDFSRSPDEYRIKPEPKYRPFKNQEECWQEMLKHQPFGWIRGKYSAILYLIDSIASDREACVSGNHVSFDFIIKNYEFADGTPCGISEN